MDKHSSWGVNMVWAGKKNRVPRTSKRKRKKDVIKEKGDLGAWRGLSVLFSPGIHKLGGTSATSGATVCAQLLRAKKKKKGTEEGK